MSWILSLRRWFTRCWGFVVLQVLGVWVVDLAEVGFWILGIMVLIGIGIVRIGVVQLPQDSSLFSWHVTRHPRCRCALPL